MNTDEEIIARLLQDVPELIPVLDEHTRSNDEVLPHVFFGDVTRYVQAELRHRDTDSVRRILLAIEVVSTNNLIEVSFLENLKSDEEIFRKLEQLAGPEMKKALQRERSLRDFRPTV